MDGPNPGKKPCKTLVERTICRSCRKGMSESAGISRPNDRPKATLELTGRTTPYPSLLNLIVAPCPSGEWSVSGRQRISGSKH
jgi:hypothetical protein